MQFSKLILGSDDLQGNFETVVSSRMFSSSNGCECTEKVANSRTSISAAMFVYISLAPVQMACASIGGKEESPEYQSMNMAEYCKGFPALRLTAGNFIAYGVIKQ